MLNDVWGIFCSIAPIILLMYLNLHSTVIDIQLADVSSFDLNPN